MADDEINQPGNAAGTLVRPARSPRWLILAGLAIVALCSACDFDSMSEPAAAVSCSQIGAQCQLPDGPLGVCQQTNCDAGVQPPCFKCTSQH